MSWNTLHIHVVYALASADTEDDRLMGHMKRHDV